MNGSPSQSRALSGPPAEHLRTAHNELCGFSCEALWLSAVLGLAVSVPVFALPAERPAMQLTPHQLPLTFEANQGQTDARVDFLARGQGYTLFLTPNEAVFALTAQRGGSKRSGNGREPDAPQSSGSVMRMQLVGGASDPEVQGLEELPGKIHYFRGNDPAHWRTNVRAYQRVKYTSVYPGVDLIYYGRPQQLEYDFIVAPGADPSAIELAFTGVAETTVNARGDLELRTTGGPLRFQRPVIYQSDGERRLIVDGEYVRKSPRVIGFRVGAYDRTRPLIVDPVLSYSTYLGGSHSDEGGGIAVDAQGAAYVTGFTASSDFPTANALQPTHGNDPVTPTSGDALVAKLTPDGMALAYATYLGGNDEDNGFGIAVDSSGAAYISGSTRSTDFPTARALQVAKNGGVDAFVAKLSADGSQLIYSTYLGGSNDERLPVQGFGRVAIAVDSAGAAYVAGTTLSPDFPTTDAFQPECVGALVNAFVAKLTPDGSALAYSTFLGGSSRDGGEAIAVDALGAAYVTGVTESTDFPTANPVQSFMSGGSDAFVAKLAPDGRSLIYSTHLGGSSTDLGLGIATDLGGAAYVTGVTLSSDFPKVNPLRPVAGRAFVVKLPPEGGALMYATPLGGSVFEEGLSITVDTAGAAYVSGWTASPDFPTIDPVQAVFGGSSDVFVAKLRPDGAALVYSTYLGGSDVDGFGGAVIAIDLAGAAYVAGTTTSPDFPTVRPLQANLAGLPGSGLILRDAFVAKLTGDSLAGAPANDSNGSDQSREGEGGGAVDALLAVLLAQLSLARALRQRFPRATMTA